MNHPPDSEVIRHIPNLALFVTNEHHAIIERDRLNISADRLLQVLERIGYPCHVPELLVGSLDYAFDLLCHIKILPASMPSV